MDADDQEAAGKEGSWIPGLASSAGYLSLKKKKKLHYTLKESLLPTRTIFDGQDHHHEHQEQEETRDTLCHCSYYLILDLIPQFSWHTIGDTIMMLPASFP
jgi:hypothetical protein